MNRRLFITLHLFFSAFLAMNILLVAVSGGLYLLGSKGSVATEKVASLSLAEANIAQGGLDKPGMAALLAKADVTDHDFEYVKQKGDTLYTRPTSKAHYVVKVKADSVEVSFAQPDLVAAMMELHKGHGPQWFKTYSIFLGAALVFIICSGLYLGLTSPMLKRRTLATTAAGAGVFLILALGLI